MNRSIEEALLAWKHRESRMPLLLRGARQVGKTYTVEQFGANHFESHITLNFEQNPELMACFEELNPKKIISILELKLNLSIQPQKTLIFLDEIQECPNAISALRYFKEQAPEYPVIGAGSLLEFALKEENFRMPVGRIEFLYLRPLSFMEFLKAYGKEKLAEYISTIELQHPVEPSIHQELLKLVREYVGLGGMPAVLSEYFKTHSLYNCQRIQQFLLMTYRGDFGKYAKHTQHKNLQLLFERAPGLIAQWFKYAKVDPSVQPRDIKIALEKLCDAGLLYLVHTCSAAGLPLITTINPKKFKLLFLDIGLARRACGIDLSLLIENDNFLLNEGMLTEQFVGQELLAYFHQYEAGHLFFWNREKTGSSAEVDYIITIDGHIVPIEVKSGAVGKLKSLKLFMQEKSSILGLRISQAPLSFENKILSVPFYLISRIPDFVKRLISFDM